METFRKTDHRPQKISYEVTALLWLADAGDQATRIVPVLDYGKTWLEEPVLSRIEATPRMAEEFGRALAYTHAAGAPHLGAPPPGHTTDGWMGEAPLPLLADGGSTTPNTGLSPILTAQLLARQTASACINSLKNSHPGCLIMTNPLLSVPGKYLDFMEICGAETSCGHPMV